MFRRGPTSLLFYSPDVPKITHPNAVISDPIDRIWIPGGFQASVHSETDSSTIFYRWVWKMTLLLLKIPGFYLPIDICIKYIHIHTHKHARVQVQAHAQLDTQIQICIGIHIPYTLRFTCMRACM